MRPSCCKELSLNRRQRPLPVLQGSELYPSNVGELLLRELQAMSLFPKTRRDGRTDFRAHVLSCTDFRAIVRSLCNFLFLNPNRDHADEIQGHPS